MKPLHSDYIVHIKNEEDQDVLTRKLFDVNLRLLKTSFFYNKIITLICKYLIWCCKTEKDGYKKPHGMSGANIGIPFNIIAYMKNGDVNLMINPKITRYSKEIIISQSNCGSLTLDEPISIRRPKYIDVEFYDLEGIKRELKNVSPKAGSLTIQHEVQHNLGVLITDLEIK